MALVRKLELGLILYLILNPQVPGEWQLGAMLILSLHRARSLRLLGQPGACDALSR
jgi:hypothetical protein